MNADLKFYKGLVDLLESHADECWFPTRNDWQSFEAAFPSKFLKRADQSMSPRLSRKCEIDVFCSVIHLNSAIVFLLAQHDLRAHFSLGVNFFQTSSSAVRGFQKATAERRPALVTVTDGTARLLSQSPAKFWQFMTVPPSSLKLASTEKIGSLRTTDLTRLQYTVVDHPTDLGVFEDFKKKHLSKGGRPADLLLIDDVPESVEILSKAKGGQVLLVNTSMARWATASVGGLRPLFLLGGWQVVENRFIFGNRFFRDLADDGRCSVAYWLYGYLKERFVNMRRQKGDFVTNTRIGKEALTKAARTDYFKF